MTECEVFIVVDEDGSYTVSNDLDTVWEQAEADLAKVCRLVCLTVNVPLPECVTAHVDVPAQPAVKPVVTVK